MIAETKPLAGVEQFPPALPSRHTRSLLADLLALAVVGAGLACLLLIARQFTAPLQVQAEIDLSLWALPRYTLLSLARGFAAYLLSLVFTLVYGTIAAHHPRAERFMIPALDVFQAIPVLGFLPGLVLAMIALFPTRELGLEFASILMIFTGQVWNMVFSFHASLRSIPQPLREVAAIYRLSGWQTFRSLEVPSAMIGLVWNSMMSMAGGWFFLTVTEAFTLRNQDYRLPGVGAYMNEAILRGNGAATGGAIVAMILMIVLVDQLVWRPLVVWSQRFKLEDTAESGAARSWVFDLLARSHLLRIGRRLWSRRRRKVLYPIGATTHRFSRRTAESRSATGAGRLARRAVGIIFLGWLLWGGWKLVDLLATVPLYNGSNREDWLTVLLALGASFLRTSAAVLLGAAWAVPAGIVIGRSPTLARRCQPLIQVAASFPAPMLFPLVTAGLVWSGFPFNIGCTLLMMLGTQWYILFNTIAGAQAIPGDLSEVCRTFRLRPSQRWWRLYLPCVFPYLTTGLITAAGGAWNATIVAEYVLMGDGVHAAFGLGSLINHATASGDFPLLAAGVTTMAVSVVAINRLVWRRLYQLAEERFRLMD